MASDCETFAPFTIWFVVPQSWSVTGEPGEITSVDDAVFTEDVANVQLIMLVVFPPAVAPKPLPDVDVVTSTWLEPLSITELKNVPMALELTLLPLKFRFKLLSITGPALFAVKVMEPIC